MKRRDFLTAAGAGIITAGVARPKRARALGAEVDLYDPTSADIQAFVDDTNTAVCNIYGDGWLTKDRPNGCVELRHTVPKTINLYGRLLLVPQTYSGDTHLFYSTNAGFSGLTINGGILDGQWAEGSGGNEQMHGVNGVNGENVRFYGVTFRNFKGDGIKAFGNVELNKSRLWWLVDCITADNGRSGITMQRSTEDFFIINCLHYRNKDQSIDFEPTGVTPEKRPRRILIQGGGIIEHVTAAHALTLSQSNEVTIRDYYIDGSVQGVSVIDLVMDNVRIKSTIPLDEVTIRKGIQLIKNCQNLRFNNVHLEQRGSAIAAAFEYSNGAWPDGVRWTGGSITNLFPAAAVNLSTVDNAIFEGLDLIGAPGNDIAVHIRPLLADIAYNRVEKCYMANWQRGVRVITDGNTIGRLDIVGNRYQNVTVPYEQTWNSIVTRLDYERNEI